MAVPCSPLGFILEQTLKGPSQLMKAAFLRETGVANAALNEV